MPIGGRLASNAGEYVAGVEASRVGDGAGEGEGAGGEETLGGFGILGVEKAF